jgi:hypothetical protein
MRGRMYSYVTVLHEDPSQVRKQTTLDLQDRSLPVQYSILGRGKRRSPDFIHEDIPLKGL